MKRNTNNHSVSQSQQQMQATDIQEEEIKMSITILYVENTIERLPHVFKSYKIRSTFYTENTLHKILCKPKDVLLRKIKTILFMKLTSDYKAVYIGESERSLKSWSDEHKRPVRNWDYDKNEIAKHYCEANHNFSWNEKKVVDQESRLIHRKIIESIIFRRTLITLAKFPTCFLKYGLLIYGSS